MALDLGVEPTGLVEVVTHRQRRRFSNLVLDRGWGALLERMDGDDGAMVPRWLSFGTGDSDPEPSDQGLEQRVSSTEKEAESVSYGGQVDAGSLTAYSEAVVRFDYEAGELTGEWVELGLAYGSGASEPYNRALIRDENNVPTPLLVLPSEPVTVYVRLRLHIAGWGKVVSFPVNDQGQESTLNIDPSLASESQGLWLKGLPLKSAVIGGLDGQREGFIPDESSASFYFATSPWESWNASRITVKARDDSPMLRLDLSPRIESPAGTSLHLRFRITMKKG